MYQADFRPNSFYHMQTPNPPFHHPNPNSQTYASAPPFAPNYTFPDYPQNRTQSLPPADNPYSTIPDLSQVQISSPPVSYQSLNQQSYPHSFHQDPNHSIPNNPHQLSAIPLNPNPNHSSNALYDHNQTIPTYPHQPSSIPPIPNTNPISNALYDRNQPIPNYPHQPSSTPPNPNSTPCSNVIYDNNRTILNYPHQPSSIPPNLNSNMGSSTLYDHNQSDFNYPNQTSSVHHNSNPNPGSNTPYSYNHIGYYETPYDKISKFDGCEGYLDENPNGYGIYGKDGSYSGSNLGINRMDSDLNYGDGVYAYEGGKSQSYGSRGMSSKSNSSVAFDDYGRPINSLDIGKDRAGSVKIVKAVPKIDTQQDGTSGVQKFRVKILPECGGQSSMDVLCQIGLDGIRMVHPTESRTLRIYPLDTVTKCDVTESCIFTFWAKSSVDIEPRRIRLQSNSYTTSTLLDTVTAATVQLKEMGGRIRPSDSFQTTDQPIEKKKGLTEWVSKLKPANEEKDHWVPDEATTKCTGCGTDFGAFVRRHHCRNCGDIFCDKCTHGRIALTADENAQPVRVCDRCVAEVTQRLSNANEIANKPAGLQSHEDLSKKLQEEMERNRKTSSGNKPDGSGRRMREVACPTCTVHLQVQVPSSGSETIECGVCQHPFLVSAH